MQEFVAGTVPLNMWTFITGTMPLTDAGICRRHSAIELMYTFITDTVL